MLYSHTTGCCGLIGELQQFKATYLKAMAHPVRIRILEILRHSDEVSVAELQAQAGADVANISQHLAVLRGGGIVTARKAGLNVLYRVREPEVFAILDALRQIFSQRVDAMRSMLRQEDAAAGTGHGPAAPHTARAPGRPSGEAQP